MLIIPVIGKISLKNPPFVTLFLILANVLMYFTAQWNDRAKVEAAYDFYMSSDLPKIELLYYQAYVAGDKKLPIVHVPGKIDLPAVKEVETFSLWEIMREDGEFFYLLEKNRVVLSQDELYPWWLDLKTGFQNRLNESMIYRFGLKPSAPKWYAFFTCMFLHGGFEHLLGNMIFLWLLGCFLEMGCGRSFYLAVYLLSGLAAGASFWLIYPHSTSPLIGASGAIAGMMGSFAVLFGKKKVKIFFSLGFYFGYRQMTAIALLPLWFCNEVYQLFFSGMPQVAYVAHIGGILSGAILSFIHMKSFGIYDENAVSAEPEDTSSPMVEKALEHIGNLEIQKGRGLLDQVLEKDPGHVPALTHLFNLLKNMPEESRFQDITKTLLEILMAKPATWKVGLKIINDYEKAAGRWPKLSPELYVKIGVVYAYDEQPEASEKILSAMLLQKPELQSIPPAMLKLAEAYKKKGRFQDFKDCLQTLIEKYPGSKESQVAEKILLDG
ncbi:MAG: rhomboid family intramembrane serine protease [Desulfobacteraceae bacterium]|nr:rhomboid family intramembrane serine protease [Desulfobacteraceae bacterium]MBU4055070.1 rhomboid family intramembrane serine protease [Pseudomonadota bacterium]